jgi:hypothetical protein
LLHLDACTDSRKPITGGVFSLKYVSGLWGDAIMSDAIDRTAAGATRGLLGSYSFILVMLGLEMWTSEHATQFGLGLFLLILGGLLAYAAFFWETAKKVLSIEAQTAIGHFAQSRATWAFVIFLVVQAFVAAPFIEQRRWPFSYPAEPAIYAEKSRLENALNQANGAVGREKEFADKWRFSATLRSLRKECRFHGDVSRRAASVALFWQELLQSGGWIGVIAGAQDGLPLPAGITIRIPGDNS